MKTWMTLLQRERIQHLKKEDIIYNVRRPILEEIRADEMDNLLLKHNCWNS